jgi:hypothetical protein
MAPRSRILPEPKEIGVNRLARRIEFGIACLLAVVAGICIAIAIMAW